MCYLYCYSESFLVTMICANDFYNYEMKKKNWLFMVSLSLSLYNSTCSEPGGIIDPSVDLPADPVDATISGGL
jgi:hypothetical protein